MKGKYVIIIMIVLFIITGIVICYNVSDIPSYLSDSQFSNLTNFLTSDDIKIISNKQYYSKEETIAISFVNKTSMEYTCSEEYYLEMLYKNKWYYVIPSKMYILDLLAYRIPPEGKSNTTLEIDLLKKYPELDNGIYRIYKEIEDKNKEKYILYFEFELG